MRNIKKTKYISMLLGVLLLLQLVPSVPISANTFGSEIACFIAVKWTPVNQSWNGNFLTVAPDYGFDIDSAQTSWGRTGFPMPDAELAIDTNGYNVPASDTSSVLPLYYCIFYLNAEYDYETPTAISEKMFAVIDSAGQIWFDPDGRFNDCRHYGYASPDNILYRRDPSPLSSFDEIRLNKNCYVDPLSGNNTQGPYYLFPTKENGDPQLNFIPKAPIYFRYDTKDFKGFHPTPLNRESPIKTRLFQLGWADMPDFPLIQDKAPSVDYPLIPSIGTTLKPRAVDSGVITRWDINLSLIQFVDNGDALFEQDEEWHTGNINIDNRFTPGEYIYKRTDPVLTAPNVSSGDIRLSDVVISTSMGTTRTYRAGSVVIDNPPFGMQDPGDDLDVGRALIQFVYTGTPGTPSIGDELHTENINSNMEYDVDEFIYRKGDNTALVSENDFALTDVNTNSHRPENINADGICSIGGCVAGDLLLMVETIKSGPLAPMYNYMVESDVWMGDIPAISKTALYNPYGKPFKGSQTINKSSFLSDNGTVNNLPITIFFNVKADFRSYFGISIWNDNGIDNSFGLGSNVKAQNSTEDYWAGKRAESFLGAKYQLSSPDAGRSTPTMLTSEGILTFDASYRFIDNGGIGYGCNEKIYSKGTGTGGINQVEAGDKRHFRMTGIRNGSEITYSEGSVVAAGDSDVGVVLSNLPADLCFYDVNHGNDRANGTYDSDEDIYNDLNSNLTVDYGDIRMSDMEIGHYNYMCGDVVDEIGIWVHDYEIHGLSQGLCGSPTAIDIPALPGGLGITVKTDRYLRVEQTSHMTVKTRATLHENEKIHVVVRNLLSNGIIPFEQYMTLSPGQTQIEFEMTPYRGSLNIDGTYDPIVVTAYGDFGGVEGRPTPKDGAYQDRFFLTKYYQVKNIQNPPQLVTAVPPPWPQPTIGLAINDEYDAWEQSFLEVSCERLDVVSTRLCLDQLEERYPNISIECYNGDNISDVNDPCCIPFALGREEHTLVLFNANGAGVKWMGTAIGSGGQRYIIQYNTNRTYNFWYWNDIGLIPGAIDSGDFMGNNPGFFPPNPIGSQMPIEVSSQAQLNDIDNSAARTRPTLNDDGFLKWGVVTKGDHLGVFDGTTIDRLTGETFGEISTWGVYTYITSRGTFTETDVGGWAVGLIKPMKAGTVKLRLTSFNIMWDYNSVRNTHPADYILENHLAMDYTGFVKIKVPELDGKMNFSEFQILDRGMQFSTQDYTNGLMPTNRLPFPAPQIQRPYNPILRNLQDDFRVYPGGQTHAGRIFTGGRGMMRGLIHGWNGYPAIWSEWGQRYNKSRDAIGRDPERDKKNHTVNFNKLGTEFGPLTDYGIYFVLKDANGKHMTFDPGTPSKPTPQRYHIKQIKVTGPFKTPEILDPIKGRITTDFTVSGSVHIPLTYDFSGEVIVDNANWKWYEFEGQNFIQEIGFGPDTVYFHDLERNGFLMWNHRLDYSGIPNVIKIDELTPVSAGEIQIEVTMFDGTVKMFQDCCDPYTPFGIKVHGLSITGLPDEIPVKQDHHFDVRITEEHSMQVEMACNNAFVLVWQDRGVAFNIDGLDEPLHIGQGDTRIFFPPWPLKNSSYTSGAMYPEFFDFNENGKISFAEWESEIIGTYDLATNTWVGGMVDGRTQNYNDGMYHLDLVEESGCQITDIGIDVGGFNIGRMKKFIIERDHVVSDLEYAPVYVTAYKYGDDNSDRSFAPYYQFPWFDIAYTHEVYMAGQARANVTPADTLSIEISPQPLTAGVINEMVDIDQPLTVKITNSDGEPVNLLEGVVDLIGDRDVPPDRALLHCFRDWHPDQEKFYGKGARLPQYYWVRTDLHNASGDYHANFYLYSDWEDEPFEPISIDFSGSKEGIYKFYGFCANDAGEFDLTVYTPDRRNMGTTKVRFALPEVEYDIINIDDPEQKVFTSPGEPDFLLTAGSNRIYNIKATCRNSQGTLISQPPEDIRVCNDQVTYPAHFTPFINIPANRQPRKWFPCHNCEINYDVHVGFDKNDDGIIQRSNNELFTFKSSKSKREFLIWDDEILAPSILRRNSDIYYTTTNEHFSDNTFSRKPLIMLDPDIDQTTNGWGVGCIYNHPYEGSYLFADREPDGIINYDDFLPLDELGSCSFTIFAEDVCKIGGLVGCNPFTAGAYFGDVAGAPLPYYTDPGFLYTRYRYMTPGSAISGSEMGSRDGTFFLDWDAMPSHLLKIAPPKLILKSARTGKPLSSELFNPAFFDLAYGRDNHLMIELHPADDRDLIMSTGSSIIASGANHHELSQGGFIPWTDNENPITYLTLTPTGQGEEVIYIGYKCPNELMDKEPYNFTLSDSPQNYSIYPITSFDSSPGLALKLIEPDKIIEGRENIIKLQVVDIATGEIVTTTKVRMQGGDIDAQKNTDANGTVTFKVTPEKDIKLLITATADGYVRGELSLRPGPQTEPPILRIDEVESITNRLTTTISGTTTPGAKVTINGAIAKVDSKGKFNSSITLIDGINTINIITRMGNLPPVSKVVTIVVDTIPPGILLPKTPELVGGQIFTIKGRVEPGCIVTANGQPAKVVYDMFSVEVQLIPGTNKIKFNVIDSAGNVTEKTLIIPVYNSSWGKLVVGERLVVNETGLPLGQLRDPLESVLNIPISVIEMLFGADYKINETIGICEVKLFGNKYVFENGSLSALVSGESVTLPTIPIIKGGMLYISPKIINEIFDCDIKSNPVTGEVTITRTWLP
jgi:Glucodextranase, domain B/Copper amine oxidase N-terminal domain